MTSEAKDSEQRSKTKYTSEWMEAKDSHEAMERCEGACV